MASVTALPGASVDAAPKTTRNYGRLLEQTWIWSVVGYSIVRFVVAWGAFSDHGANAWIFGLIDVGTAWPYGKAVAMVCKRVASSDWGRLPMPLGATIVMFFAPYAYLWFAAGEMPSGMRLGLAICVSVLFVAASAGVIAKSRKLRKEASSLETDSVVVDVREPANAVVQLASFGGAEAQPTDPSAAGHAVIDLRSPAPASELLIDLTGDGVAVERSALKR